MNKRLAIIAILLIAALSVGYMAVGGKSGKTSPGTGAQSTVYRMLYSAEVTTLNYLHTGNTNDLKVAANVVDCLVEYDIYGVVKPSLAVSWEHNEDYTIWTFKIREGVKWVDNDGKEVAEVTAHDWVSTTAYVNDAHNNSSLQYMYDGIVRNAQVYYDQTASIMDAEEAVKSGRAETMEKYYATNNIDASNFISFGEVGVKALDDYTLEFTMEVPCPFFISVLSYASFMPVYGPFLEEHGDNFGVDNEKLLYNGAYVLKTFEPQARRVLTANPIYWDKGNVFIGNIEYTYNAREVSLAPTMFLRGEVDYAVIGADLLDEWLSKDETKDSVRPSSVERSYSYFHLFNFEPRFDKQYQPENWILAANNENFRKSIMAGIDRIKAISVIDPYTPLSLLNNTITPAFFATGGGRDYVEFEPLKAIAEGSLSFNEEKALEYKKAAMAELKAAGATFPVKVLMPYSPSTINWDKQCQIIEQQLETLLGTDYIDIIVDTGPSTNFLSEIRRSGKYAFMKCNWGADYADPQTWTDPFKTGNSYNFMYTDAAKVIGGKPVTSKSRQTQALVGEYYRLMGIARNSFTDETERYQAFAEAEAFLIEHALALPFSVDTLGYVAARLDPFDAQFSAFGVVIHRFKGRKLLEKPMNIEQYNVAYEKWTRERAEAIAAAAR